jgi:hypothetical protein
VFALMLQLAAGWAVWLLVSTTAAGRLAAVVLAVAAAAALSYVTTRRPRVSSGVASVADAVDFLRSSVDRPAHLAALPSARLTVLAHEHHPAAVFLLLGPVSATWYAALHG